MRDRDGLFCFLRKRKRAYGRERPGHYAILDSGGVSPNVVRPEARVLYMVRSPHVKDALDLQKRVDKIAEGAAQELEFASNLAKTYGKTGLEKTKDGYFCPVL